MQKSKLVQFYSREDSQLQTEAIFGEGPLRWVYETFLGKAALFTLIRRAFFSRAYGFLKSRSRSRKEILPFIQKYQIDTKEFKEDVSTFSSFNDFFSRELKPEARPILPGEGMATLPADGRHLAFQNISTATTIYAKGQRFDLKKFLGNDALAEHYAGGAMVCSRLCPTDYHRFHFPVSGTVKNPQLINGHLYSVNPIALAQNLAYLWENKRILVEIDSPQFGKVLQILVGATNVGTIVPTYTENQFYAKGAELGFFRFGGSFVASIFEPNKIKLAPDLIKNTEQGYETFAKMGTLLGTAIA